MTEGGRVSDVLHEAKLEYSVMEVRPNADDERQSVMMYDRSGTPLIRYCLGE